MIKYFEKISIIFKENYLFNQYDNDSLKLLTNDGNIQYFLIKIYNEIELLKANFLFNLLERRKILDFIENSIGIKAQKGDNFNHDFLQNSMNLAENLSMNFSKSIDNFDSIELFADLLKIQNVLIRFFFEKVNKNSSILKNFFFILIIKIISAIKSLRIQEEKALFSDFVSVEEIYFDLLIKMKNELTGPNNLAQTQIP